MFPETDHEDLPADLQRLAEQLTSEADALARQYPAGEHVPPAEHVSQRQNRLPWMISGGAAAALLVSVMLLHGMFLSGGSESKLNDLSQSTGKATVPEASVEAAESTTGPTTLGETSLAEPMKLYPIGIGQPANASENTRDLSAPEWEAVLDLTPAEDWEGVELSL